MKDSARPRSVIGLFVLAILCTALLGLQEHRAALLAADSPLSPLDADAAPRQPLGQALARLLEPALWRTPWPWIAVGLLGFGLLAWILVWAFQGLERD